MQSDIGPAQDRQPPGDASPAARDQGRGMVGVAALTLAALFWAGNYAVGRLVAGDIAPATLNLLRWSTALLFLLPFAARRLPAAWLLVRRHFGWFLGLALAAVVVHPTVVYAGLNYTTATNMALIIAATPAMVLLLSSVLHGERHRAGLIAAVALSFAGIVLLVWKRTAMPNQGDLLGCAGMLCWAWYNVALRDAPAEVDGIMLTTVISALGVLLLVPLAAAEFAVRGGITFDAELLLAVLYVGLFASGISYLLWNSGVAALGASHAAQFMNLVPVFGVAIGTLLLDEMFTTRHGLAALLIVGALLLSERQRRAAA